MASMSEKRCYFGAAVCNGGLVVNGNRHDSNTAELYDLGFNCWRNIVSTNKRRSYHELVAADGDLFAIGGFDDGSSTSSVERSDDLNGKWRIVQSMNTPRRCFTAVTCNGFIYAIGGYSTKYKKTVEKYDPDNNTWTVISSMGVERWFHIACVLHEKREGGKWCKQSCESN